MSQVIRKHSSNGRGLAALLVSAVAMTISSACSLFGSQSVEEAGYQVVLQADRFELRDYDALVVVETSVDSNFKEAGNKAFQKLFAYISGKNASSEKIAMTAPVIAESEPDSDGQKIAMTAPVLAEQAENGWRYGFVLPKQFSLDSAPTPLDPDVSLSGVPPKQVAVLRFSGRLAKNKADKAEQLLEWINSQGLAAGSEPRWAGYNPPWTLPPFRRNEVLIDIR